MAGCLCGGYGDTDSKIKKVVRGELTECSLKWTERSIKWAERFLKRSERSLKWTECSVWSVPDRSNHRMAGCVCGGYAHRLQEQEGGKR